MKPNLAPTGRINISRRKAAHLTGESVAVKNFCAELGRDDAVELNRSFWGLFRQQVLSRFQVRAIVVCKDNPAFLLPQFAYTPRPFADFFTRGVANLYGGNHLPDMSKKELPDSLF